MKIKRTTAPDMRTAMKMIREEQGPDAVILGNRKVAGGIEIVSAIDYESGVIDSNKLFDDNPIAATETVSVARPAVQEPRTVVAEAAPAARWDSHNKSDLDEAERSVRRATELLRAARAVGKTVDRPPERAATPKPVVAEPLPEPAPRPALEPEPEPEPEPDPTANRFSESVRDSIDTLNRNRERSADTIESPLDLSEPAPAANSPQMKAMQRELQSMRELMTQQLNVMGWGNMTRRQPARVNLLTRLHHMGIGTELALKLCEGVDSATDPSRNWRQALTLLQSKIPESREDLIEHGGVFAMVGSTGVGKTTAIAKLAAHCAMRHGKNSVALISTDNVRVGAREQLRSFSAILDVPLVFSESAEQLEREVQRMRERRLVLIDTAGLGVNDPRLEQSLTQIRRVKAIQAVLTLPANGQLGALQQTCRTFGNCDPVGCIVTKMDEAHSIGAAVTAVVEHQLPLMWFGTGQRVPEDLTRATAASMLRLCLSTEALRKPSLLDADELTSHFGEVGSYSNV